GLFTGNRGILHDAATRRLGRRRWTTKAWICCALDYKGQRRDVMGANGHDGKAGWTELFFLDEATALAAGHRPCFACRREAAERFRTLWRAAHGAPEAGVREIDAILHLERLASGASRKPLSLIDLPGLPDGAMVASGNDAWLIAGRMARPWAFDGYAPARPLGALAAKPLFLLTPPSTVKVLRQGYRPALHQSAQ
nr:hypothetical protein [Rhizobiaceae bacterium]